MQDCSNSWSYCSLVLSPRYLNWIGLKCPRSGCTHTKDQVALHAKPSVSLVTIFAKYKSCRCYIVDSTRRHFCCCFVAMLQINDLGEDQKWSHAKHSPILMIIVAKYWNQSRTAYVTAQTRQDFQYWSSFYFCCESLAEWHWRYRSSSNALACYTYSDDCDDLSQILFPCMNAHT